MLQMHVYQNGNYVCLRFDKNLIIICQKKIIVIQSVTVMLKNIQQLAIEIVT